MPDLDSLDAVELVMALEEARIAPGELPDDIDLDALAVLVRNRGPRGQAGAAAKPELPPSEE